MPLALYADSSEPSLFARVVLAYLGTTPELRSPDGSITEILEIYGCDHHKHIQAVANRRALMTNRNQVPTIDDGNKKYVGVSGVVDYVKEHGGDLADKLLGSTDAEKKEVDGHIKMATGELYEALKSGDNKKILAPIFKVNKAITPNTYFVSNHVTLADLIFYAYLHKTISSWDEKQRSTVVCICRWLDLLQHDSRLASTQDFLPSIAFKL